MHSVLYDIYTLCNIHNSENSHFVRIFKCKGSQREETNIFHNIPFTIYISQYEISHYALHSMHFKVGTSQYSASPLVV